MFTLLETGKKFMTKRVPKYLCVIWFWHVQPHFAFLVSIIIWYFEHPWGRLCLHTRVEGITCKYACWRVSVRGKKSGEVSLMSTVSFSGVLGPPLSPTLIQRWGCIVKEYQKRSLLCAFFSYIMNSK